MVVIAAALSGSMVRGLPSLQRSRMEIPDDEARALRDVWSQSEKVDWDAYDRLKARILSITEVKYENDVLDTVGKGE
jgi:hypothetical protein